MESVGDREALGAVWVDLLDRTEWLLAFTADPDLAATAQSLAHESVPAPAATPSPARPAASRSPRHRPWNLKEEPFHPLVCTAGRFAPAPAA